MRTNLDDYIEVTEFMDSIQTELNDKFYIDVPYKALVLAFKRYEEFKKRMEEE